MTFDFKVVLDTKGLDNLQKKGDEGFSNEVKKTAFRVHGEAALNAPVDTGALRNSLEAVEVNRLLWKVRDGVQYGIFQELGTSRGITAKHFLGNACEKLANSFFSGVRDVINRLAK